MLSTHRSAWARISLLKEFFSFQDTSSIIVLGLILNVTLGLQWYILPISNFILLPEVKKWNPAAESDIANLFLLRPSSSDCIWRLNLRLWLSKKVYEPAYCESPYNVEFLIFSWHESSAESVCLLFMLWTISIWHHVCSNKLIDMNFHHIVRAH